MDPETVTQDCAGLYEAVRGRVGDEWLREAETMSFEITERGDVVMHTGKWQSFTWGKEESEGMILVINRGQKPAQLSILEEDGSRTHLGPVELEE